MPARGITRRRAVALGALALAGCGLIAAGMSLVLPEGASRAALSDLAERTAGEGGAAPAPGAEGAGDGALGAPSRDWEALLAECPDVAAWARVGGTGIDLPVVMAADEAAEAWWLRHDLWGDWTLSGTPFVDHRASNADDRNVVVYGHHLTGIGGAFSELQLAYDQQAFDCLGGLSWETPARASALSPLCAMSVDEGWPDIQRFEWASVPDGDFREWLAGIAGQGTARAEGWEALCAGATRCVALVTCSSDWSYQPWRTVALWCA